MLHGTLKELEGMGLDTLIVCTSRLSPKSETAIAAGIIRATTGCELCRRVEHRAIGTTIVEKRFTEMMPSLQKP